MPPKRITPFLWFDTQAEEAANFYVSIFRNSKLGKIMRYGKNAPLPEGTVMTIKFELDGQPFAALNGGPHFKFTEAVSFSIRCDSQEDVDHYWTKLCQGGEESMCGWLKDKFGLSWQVVPTALIDMLGDSDPAKARRVTEAMLQMKKIDIATLERAYNA